MKNYDFIEPTHEWFDCICLSCKKVLPDTMNPSAGGTIGDGDTCPYCGAVLQEHEDIKEVILMIAHKNGYKIREGRLESMVLKFEQMLSKYGAMYCPCQQQQNEDTVCPCRYMREHGACRCGLYMRKEE